MTTFGRDAYLALRWFRRRPGLYGLIVTTLAVGIGVNVSMFSFVHPNIVGKSIVLDGGAYVVDGVLAPSAMDFPPDVQLYRQVTEYHGLDGRRHSVVGKLQRGVSLDVARQELKRFQTQWEQHHPETNRGVHFDVVPLRDTWVAAARPYLATLASAVGLVLLMAVANVVNLLLARSADREREMAVRSSLGASRRRLIRQLLAEGLVLTALGGVLGLALAAGSLRALTHLVRADLPAWMEIRIEPSALGFAAGLVLLTGIATGLVPAFRVTRSSLATTARAGARGTGHLHAHRLRSLLVTCQVALALVLLLGAGLMTRSALALQSGVTDPGTAIAAWSTLLLVAAGACLAPALRASLVSPIDSMREAE